MTIQMKVLRLEPTGADGMTAMVGLDNDSPVGFRVVGIIVPVGHTASWAKDWILAIYTKQQLWDLPTARDVNGRERQRWLLLWHSGELIDAIALDKADLDTDKTAIDPDIDELDTDIAAVGSATLAQLQQIVKRTMQHQKRILQREKRALTRENRVLNNSDQIIKVVENLARETGVGGVETLGEQ